jgi:tRNA(Arg) A34 adenosine deaminase TadA
MDGEDIKFVRLAIEQSRKSITQGGYPFGAVIVRNGKVISMGISTGSTLHDPTSHGEVAAIRNACAILQTSELGNATLYASSQPCVMCLGASMWSGITKIVYACSTEKVSSAYYGGDYRISDINTYFLHPITLIHCAELENESLATIQAWETAQAKES